MREPNAVHDKLGTDEDEEGKPLHMLRHSGRESLTPKRTEEQKRGVRKDAICRKMTSLENCVLRENHATA